MPIHVFLVETTCMITELYPERHICDGKYSRVSSPGKRWLIIKKDSYAYVPHVVWIWPLFPSGVMTFSISDLKAVPICSVMRMVPIIKKKTRKVITVCKVDLKMDVY